MNKISTDQKIDRKVLDQWAEGAQERREQAHREYHSRPEVQARMKMRRAQILNEIRNKKRNCLGGFN